MTRFATQIRSILLALPHYADLVDRPLSPRQLDGCRKLLDLFDKAEHPEEDDEMERYYGALSLVEKQGGEVTEDRGSLFMGACSTAVLEFRPDFPFSLASLDVVFVEGTPDQCPVIKSVRVGSRVLATGPLLLAAFSQEDAVYRLIFYRHKRETPGTPIRIEITNASTYAIRVACKASLNVPADKNAPPRRATFDEDNEGPSVDVNLPAASLWTAAQGAFSALLFEKAKRDGTLAKAAQKAANNIGNAGKEASGQGNAVFKTLEDGSSVVSLVCPDPIAPGATVTISQRVFQAFRIKKILVNLPTEIDLRLLSLHVGSQQLIEDRDMTIPAFRTWLRAGSVLVKAGEVIKLRIRYTGDRPVSFQVDLIGEVEP